MNLDPFGIGCSKQQPVPEGFFMDHETEQISPLSMMIACLIVGLMAGFVIWGPRL